MGWRSGFLSRFGARAGAAVIAALLLGVPLSARAAAPPEGYRELRMEHLAPGVDHEVYQRFGPQEAVHVARIGKDAPYVMRSVPASDFIHGGREPTSAICRRTKCLIGVNGDFWTGPGELLGALVHHGELLRTATQAHYQLLVSPDGHLAAGSLQWHGRVITSDNRSLDLDGVNVPRKRDGVVLYTRSYARSTKTDHSGIELLLSIVRPSGEPRLGTPSIVAIKKIFVGRGNSLIAPGTLVLSGSGKGAESLRALWHRAKNGGITHDAQIRLRTVPETFESIGGTPVLVRDGRPVFDDAPTSFVQRQHPRTIVGWTKAGDTLLVTVDGRQPGHSLGMTIPEAARMMLKLGAVDAINLDGGGSTTFVVRGNVLNKPADRVITVGGVRKIVEGVTGHRSLITNVERPVASALVVVKRPPEPKPEPAKVRVSVDVAAIQEAPAHALSGSLGSARAVVAFQERHAGRPLRAVAVGLFATAVLALATRARRMKAARRRNS